MKNDEMKPSEIREEGKRLFEKSIKRDKVKKLIKNYIKLVIMYLFIGTACGFGSAFGIKLVMEIMWR